jgi:beta-N-acetylhexosaminidase
MSLGPVMMDLVGTGLTDQEREMLSHPKVGGVILFSRNFYSIAQLTELISAIHSLREPHLLVAVDQEGGRVQRFTEGFTRLPSATKYGELYKRDPASARTLAATVGWLMAAELRAVGVDFSFAPVLDLAHGVSGVIGDRALHRSPDVVADLAHHLMSGMRRVDMEAVGKHFPGHGGVKEDSHTSLPVDYRRIVELQTEDLVPFERLIHYGLAGIMAAHVIYTTADSRPAGFSPYWIRRVLRNQLGFQGAVFTDDLSMEAAHFAGGFLQRATTALEAGCDMVLICNHPEGVMEVLAGLKDYENAATQVRLARFHGRRKVDYEALHKSNEWHHAVQSIKPLANESPELEMNL